MVKRKLKRSQNKVYSQDVIGLMEMLQDIGHTPVTRFGNIKETKKALKNGRIKTKK